MFNELTNEYLMGIRFNNNKEWFAEHKEMYRENVHLPMVELADDIFARMQAMDKDFMEKPKISRPNRDIRFSSNKNPYKECKWFFLRGDGKPDITYPKPTFFFEISPDWWRYGFFFAPNPKGMQEFRQKIDSNPAQLKRIIKLYNKQKTFVMSGENYKRLFNKEMETELLEWYQKKFFEFTCWQDYSNDVFYTEDLADLVFEGFKEIYPVYNYFR